MRFELKRRTELALRALRALSTEPIRSSELAAALGTTPSYLPQVLRPFVDAGWVVGTPGPTGGYRLETDLSTKSILDLIDLSEGSTEEPQCLLRGGPCDSPKQCELHEAWTTARAALLAELGDLPIQKGLRP